MNGQKLQTYLVDLHRRGGATKGQLEVQAAGDKHAGRVAVKQAVEVSRPKSKPGDWIVDKVEVKPA